MTDKTYIQWNLRSWMPLNTYKSVYKQISWTKFFSSEKRCLKRWTCKQATSWGNKLGVSAREHQLQCSFCSIGQCHTMWQCHCGVARCDDTTWTVPRHITPNNQHGWVFMLSKLKIVCALEEGLLKEPTCHRHKVHTFHAEWETSEKFGKFYHNIQKFDSVFFEY